MVEQGFLQGHEGQGLLEAVTQMPTAYLAGEHIHDHGQVDKLEPKSNIGHSTDPNLFGLGDPEEKYQIGKAG